MSGGMSSLDPIFWLYHANVDRLWASSAIPLVKQQAPFPDLDFDFPGMFHDEMGAPGTPKLSEMLDLSNYNYTYDVLNAALISEQAKSILNEITASQKGLSKLNLDLPGQMRSLGSTAVAETNKLGTITEIDVPVEQIVGPLTTLRLQPLAKPFGLDNFGVDTGSLLARISDVQPLPGSTGNMLKVFVNCPYLNSKTPSTDPFFAGALSFFGCPPEICGPKTYWVDLTEPLKAQLKNGSLDAGAVKVQLVAYDNEKGLGSPVASIGSVEIFEN